MPRTLITTMRSTRIERVVRRARCLGVVLCVLVHTRGALFLQIDKADSDVHSLI